MKSLGIACALVLASVRIAWGGAGGLNLGWNDCGGLPASINRSFACNTNTGTFTLIGSFVAPSSIVAASGVVATLHLQSTGFSLPSWWRMAPGLCRAGSMTVNFDFTNGPFSCIDYWQGGASGSIVMGFPTGNRTAITITGALPAGSPLITSIAEGDEVYAFKMVLDAAKSTGLGACPGCMSGAAICLSSITVTQPEGTAGGDRHITLPAFRVTTYWQGGIGSDYYCDATPTRNATWGSIKSLYR